MAESAKSALSREEWRKRQVERFERWREPSDLLSFVKMGRAGALVIHAAGPRKLGHKVEIPAADRHAVAAMALHEQRFGFRRHDVDLVRHAADLVHAAARAIAGRTASSSTADDLRDLADRIDALLPPGD